MPFPPFLSCLYCHFSALWMQRKSVSNSLLPRAAAPRVKTKESSDTLFTRKEYHCFYSFLQLQRSKRCRVDRPDGRPQRQYRRRRNRQLIDAHRQESLGQLRIRAQLAADADPDSRPVRVLRPSCGACAAPLDGARRKTGRDPRPAGRQPAYTASDRSYRPRKSPPHAPALRSS